MPDYTIPPDLEVHSTNIMRSVWHFPPDVWEPIWEVFGGEVIKVAILDTGVSPHPDLPEPIAARSFISGQSAVRDGNGHGTHVAGTAVGRNGTGGSPKAELIVGKVLSDQGSGSAAGIERGVRWAAEQGADIINLSLGSGQPYKPTNDAIDYACSLGCIVLAAAGNSGYRGANTVGWPAKHGNAVCVGATRRDRTVADFSSGGRELDFAAPGERIVSCSNSGSGHREMSGTSMATPALAGIMGNVLQMRRGLGMATWTSADGVRDFGKQYSDDIGEPGKDVRTGFGIPNITKITEALSEAATKWI